MRKLLILAAVVLAGVAVLSQLLPAERRAQLRERLSRLPEECNCPCHQAEGEHTDTPEEEERGRRLNIGHGPVGLVGTPDPAAEPS